MKIKNKKQFNFNISQALLIIAAVALTFISIGMNQPINYTNASHNQRVSNSIRNEAMSNLNTDRESRSKNRLITTAHMQSIADTEAKREYKVIKNKPRVSKYSFHELSTNGYHPKTNTGKKLNHHSDVRYGENCAEISFGQRTFRNPNHRFQPFRSVRLPWQVANLVNTHFMNYDQANHNIHRKNILSPHDETMGVSVIYSNKLNRGILVEEFARKDKMYNYQKRVFK